MKTRNQVVMNKVHCWLALSAVVGVLFLTGRAKADFVSIVVDHVAGMDAALTTNNYDGIDAFFIGNAGGTEVGRMLIDFDLSAIPAGSTIDSATLRIAGLGTYFGHPGNPTTISIRRTPESWTTDATWNTKDGATPWAAVGGGVLGGVDSSLTSDFEGSSVSRVDFSFTGLAGAVQGWLDDPASNYGFMIRNNDEVIPEVRKYMAWNWWAGTAPHLGGSGADFEGRPVLDVEFTHIPEPVEFSLVTVEDTIGMEFPTLSANVYRLEFTEDLVGSSAWVNAGMWVEGNGTNRYLFDPSGFTTQKAYRVISE